MVVNLTAVLGLTLFDPDTSAMAQSLPGGTELSLPARSGQPRSQPLKFDDAALASHFDGATGGGFLGLGYGVANSYYDVSRLGETIEAATTDQAYIRKVIFPRLSFSANDSFRDLYIQLKKTGGLSEPSVAKSQLSPTIGRSQYSRATGSIGLVMTDSLIAIHSDTQIATTTLTTETQPSKLQDQSNSEVPKETFIDLSYRSIISLGYGRRLSLPTPNVKIGYFGFYSLVNQAGQTLRYEDLIVADRRNKALRDQSTSYQGLGHNIGIAWQIGQRYRPTITLNQQNVGSTVLKSATGEKLISASNTALGLSAVKQFKRNVSLGCSFTASHLEDYKKPIESKAGFGTSTEWHSAGSLLRLGLQTGFSVAGLSYGTHFKVGILNLSFNSHRRSRTRAAFGPYEALQTVTAAIDLAQ